MKKNDRKHKKKLIVTGYKKNPKSQIKAIIGYTKNQRQKTQKQKQKQHQ